MTEQPEALRLANKLEGAGTFTGCHIEAAAELRRLHMENEDLKNACKIYNDALKEEKALNAQLLEALETCGEDEWYTDDDYGMVQTYDEDKVRTAIAAAKEKV